LGQQLQRLDGWPVLGDQLLSALRARVGVANFKREVRRLAAEKQVSQFVPMQEQRCAQIRRLTDEKLLALGVQAIDAGHGRHAGLDDCAFEWVTIALWLPGRRHYRGSAACALCPGRESAGCGSDWFTF
jgi:hypothetical protein